VELLRGDIRREQGKMHRRTVVAAAGKEYFLTMTLH
jgi:hypothetical protein